MVVLRAFLPNRFLEGRPSGGSSTKYVTPPFRKYPPFSKRKACPQRSRSLIVHEFTAGTARRCWRCPATIAPLASLGIRATKTCLPSCSERRHYGTLRLVGQKMLSRRLCVCVLAFFHRERRSSFLPLSNCLTLCLVFANWPISSATGPWTAFDAILNETLGSVQSLSSAAGRGSWA